MEYFPNNSLACYTTKLPQHFDLSGEWEVGLSEIQFPISWYNINTSETGVHIVSTLDDNSKPMHMSDISPPPGFYETPDVLIKQINDGIIRLDKTDTTRFLFNSISKKISIYFDPNRKKNASIKISKILAELMGFSSDTYVSKDGKWVHIFPNDKSNYYHGESVCDLQRGFYSLYIYCDIVENVVVGDVKVPLLRVVNINGKEGLTVSRLFNTVQYVPIQRKQFDTIEINIRDDTGRLVPFERGKVVVTLHFRLVKPSYF